MLGNENGIDVVDDSEPPALASTQSDREEQGRSKRSGWSGHGRTNNRAGNFFFLVKFCIIFFLARIIIEPGIFSILFLKQRRHSRKNVHFDDSISGRFRPSHINRLRGRVVKGVGHLDHV